MGKLKWLFTEGVMDLTSYRLGQVQERERIIKLLEDKNARTDYRGNGPTFSMREIIALIKGENK